MNAIYTLGKIHLWILLLCGTGSLMAQPSGSASNKAFYEQQKAVYQEWLNQAGLGQIIRVKEIGLSRDTLNLYLTVYNPNIPQKGKDGAGYFFTNFRNARKKFQANNSLSLEQQLFLKLLHIMEVDPAKASVQLYDNYDVSQPILGFYGIYYEDQQIQVDSSGFKGTDHSVPVYLVVKESAESGTTVREQVSPSRVFSCIKSFFNQRIQTQAETNDCTGFQATYNAFRIDENKYQFSVKPLCKEVLSHQNKPAICDWLNRMGFNCTTIKREWLTYVFTVKPSQNGYQLDCYIDGKCKSPEVFTGTHYKIIDHDKASKAILQEYGDELLDDLRSYLEDCH